MSESVNKTLDLIHKSLYSIIADKKPHKIVYEIDANNGGISDRKITIKSTLGEEINPDVPEIFGVIEHQHKDI